MAFQASIARRWAWLPLAWLLFFCATLAHADAGPPADFQANGRTIVRFRADALGVQPKVRAERAAASLRMALEGSHEEVSIVSVPEGTLVLLGGQMLFAVTPGDLEPNSPQTVASLTETSVAELKRVVLESRESRNKNTYLRGGWHVLAETAVALLLWLLVRRGAAFLERRLQRVLPQRGQSLAPQDLRRLWMERARLWTLRVISWLRLGVVLTICYGWLGTILLEFPQTRAWGERLNGSLIDFAWDIASGILREVPNLLTAAAMFLVAYVVSKIARTFLERVEAGTSYFGWLDTDTVRPTRTMLNILIWVFALVMAYPYLPGAETEAFKGISVLLGLMVSLGAGSLVAQAASGLIVMYSRTLRVGEYVRIGEYEGTIVAIGMFLTRIRTGRGAEVTFPNSMLLSTATQNYSRGITGTGFVLDTTVTIGYDAPWRLVHEMLSEAARRTSGVRTVPAPRVYQTGLADFYPEYALSCVANSEGAESRAEALSELHAHIQDVFNENGVQIMSPHYFGDPTNAKVVPEHQVHRRAKASPQLD